ncbi:hypothetical protein ANCDUO_11589 [Ancylostoma duodenale]|uniref:Uncharacterized protein n=1 Tax=Ancylostoma duodenale TaxID=51022 RepID=A0A0C2D7T3_9BILA|nr:hypothetical protein ANCDUO_11589 [Ancylostoma duodenale]
MRRWLWWLTAAATFAALLAQHFAHIDSLLQHDDQQHDCPERCPVCREPQCEHTVLDQCGCCPIKLILLQSYAQSEEK